MVDRKRPVQTHTDGRHRVNGECSILPSELLDRLFFLCDGLQTPNFLQSSSKTQENNEQSRDREQCIGFEIKSNSKSKSNQKNF